MSLCVTAPTITKTSPTTTTTIPEAEWDINTFETNKSANPSWGNQVEKRVRRFQDIPFISIVDISNPKPFANKNVSSSTDKGSALRVKCTRPRRESGADDKGGSACDEGGEQSWPFESSPYALFRCTKEANDRTLFDSSTCMSDLSFNENNWNTMSGDDEANDNGIKSASRRGGSNKGGSSSKKVPRSKSGSSTGTNSTQETPPQRRRRKKRENGDERDRSVSPPKYDNTSMTTPAISKIRSTAKKPPTLNKRHLAPGVTPSVVTQMKFQKALVSNDDDSDSGSIDMDELLAADDKASKSSKSKTKDELSKSNRLRSTNKTATSLQALGNSRRKRKDQKSAMNKSMSSIEDMARPARTKSAGDADMNRSFAFEESKRRAGRKPKSSNREERLNQSFHLGGGSSNKISERLKVSAADDDFEQDESSRGAKKSLTRAKSDSEGRLKNALRLFSGGASDEPPEPVRQKKSFSTTLSALQNLASAGVADDDDGGGAKDLKSAIMQQVQRSASAKFEMNLFAKKGKKEEDEKVEVEEDKQQQKIGTLKLDRLKSAKALRRARTESNIERSTMRPDGPIEIKISLPSKRASLRRSKTVDNQSRADKDEPSSPVDSTNRQKTSRSKSFDSGVAMRRAHEDASDSEQSCSEEDDSSASDFVSPTTKRSPRKLSGKSPTARSPTARSPRKARNVITLLKKQSGVTEDDMVDCGNRRMFHALMYKTKLGIDMEKLREVVKEDAED